MYERRFCATHCVPKDERGSESQRTRGSITRSYFDKLSTNGLGWVAGLSRTGTEGSYTSAGSAPHNVCVRQIEIVRKSGTVKSCSYVPRGIFLLKIRPYYLRAAGIFLLAAALAGCETSGSDLALKGRVIAGDEPVSGSSVTLYARAR